MAMAVAKCTCKTCGNGFEVRAYKPNRRDANSFEEWAAGNITECKECREKRLNAERAEENAKAMEAAKELGYPELVGTEKQVAWASSIRDAAMTELRDHYLDPLVLSRDPRAQIIFDGLKDIMLRHTLASWWIENMRYQSHGQILLQLMITDEKAVRALEAEVKGEAPSPETEEQPRPEPQPEEIRPEAVPEDRKHGGSVDIRTADGKVVALYEKNDAFRDIVKGMGFSWRDGWIRTPSETAGTAENIIAELGSRLLNAGFAVRFGSRELMDKAVSGDYQPMCRRWIKYAYGDIFSVVWGRDNDLYREAKSLPGAKYNPGSMGMDVPERSWAALLDFAGKRGFRITADAQERLDRLSGVARTVDPAPAQEPAYDEVDVLRSSREVLDDLKDKD